MARLLCFFIIEIIVAITSGKDVPKATIVIPIVVSATPNISVKLFANSIKYRELKNKIKKEKTIFKIMSKED